MIEPHTPPITHIGAAIRRVRVDARISMGVLARRVGVSPSTISSIETEPDCPPDWDLVREIAAALEVSAHGLVAMVQADEGER